MKTPAPLIEIDCDWPENVWAWKPDAGRWAPAFGRPRRCVDIRLSTAAQGRAHAYDSWRETVFYGFEAAALDKEAAARFSASLRGLISDSVEFYTYESDGLSGRRTRAHIDGGDIEALDIGLVLSGARRYRQDDGSELVSGPGEFFTYDTTQPCELAWDHHEALHVSLNRRELLAMTGQLNFSQTRLQAVLRSSPLSAFLRAQLLTLRENIDRLSDWEREAVLSTIKSLAAHILRSARSNDDGPDRDQDRLFDAARAFIHTHLPHPGLAAAMVAGSIGCSRATLYRSFARFNLTVAGYIREQRLLVLRERLRTSPAHVSIADIAAHCGLYDAPNVSRLFRARFGMPPSALRPGARAAETHQRSG